MTAAKSDAELRQLAMDIANGKVFTSNHIPAKEYDRLPLIFLPLVMMNDQQRLRFVNDPPGMVYQYWGEDMLSYGFDGYPTFASYRVLPQAEYDRLQPMVREAMSLVVGFVAGAPAAAAHLKEEQSDHRPGQHPQNE